jgi:DNA-binding IscR family transcriptional regulator
MSEYQTPYDNLLLRAIGEVVRHTGAPARTVAVAGRVWLSERQTRRYLVQLERRGLVVRRGQRGGWWVTAPGGGASGPLAALVAARFA